jgi:branched-subunit amino acid ABC-type transport system permease component
MLETLGAFILAALAAIIAFGFGIVALLAVWLPLAPLLLIVLLPAALLVVVLRRLGIVQGRLATLLALCGCAFLLANLAQWGWSNAAASLGDWFDESRDVLQACAAHDGAVIRLERRGGVHFSCKLPKQREDKRGTNF